VDYCVPLKEIGPLLTQIAGEPVEVAPHSVPELIEREVIMATGMEGEAQHMPLGTPSVFSCPECGGVLHEMHDGDYVYFRCRVGHAFGTESMLAEQGQALEQALWSALNTLEETANLSRRLARQAQERGQAWLAERYHARSQDAERNAAAIRQVLDKEQATLPDPSQQPV
jgi:two-component system chemotaxis response regulator CheB